MFVGLKKFEKSKILSCKKLLYPITPRRTNEKIKETFEFFEIVCFGKHLIVLNLENDVL